MVFHIVFSVLFIIAAIMITTVIVRNNRDIDGTTSLGWWLIGLGISQVCIVTIFAVWWRDWWLAHQWVMNTSCGITIFSVIMWVVAKVYTKGYLIPYSKFTPPVFWEEFFVDII